MKIIYAAICYLLTCSQSIAMDLMPGRIIEKNHKNTTSGHSEIALECTARYTADNICMKVRFVSRDRFNQESEFRPIGKSILPIIHSEGENSIDEVSLKEITKNFSLAGNYLLPATTCVANGSCTPILPPITLTADAIIFPASGIVYSIHRGKMKKAIQKLFKGEISELNWIDMSMIAESVRAL